MNKPIKELLIDFEEWQWEECGYFQYRIETRGGTVLDHDTGYYIYCFTRNGKLIRRKTGIDTERKVRAFINSKIGV